MSKYALAQGAVSLFQAELERFRRENTRDNLVALLAVQENMTRKVDGFLRSLKPHTPIEEWEIKRMHTLIFVPDYHGPQAKKEQ